MEDLRSSLVSSARLGRFLGLRDNLKLTLRAGLGTEVNLVLGYGCMKRMNA